jgi:hypothetical protein
MVFEVWEILDIRSDICAAPNPNAANFVVALLTVNTLNCESVLSELIETL